MSLHDPARHLLAVFAAAIALALALGDPASAAPWDRYRVDDAKATLKRVNSMRASFGAPRLVEVRKWSTGCAKHVAYMTARGRIAHAQDPKAADYTRAGALAALKSILSLPAREPFGREAPLGLWAEAPHHQALVLDPRLRRTGFARGCMNTLSGLKRPVAVPKAKLRPVAPRLLAWPGEGAKAVPQAIDGCGEFPSAFTTAGFSCGAGTALYVYAMDRRTGGCTRITDGAVPQVTVTAEGLALPVAVVQATPCGWIAVTGMPLPPDASVRMDVVFAGATLTHRFSTAA